MMKHQATPYKPPPADQLNTIFVDEWLIVCDKPSGLLSVPGRGPEKAVCAHSIISERHGDVLVVHRLDMDTSGLLVFARTKDVQRALSRAFEQRQIEKSYEALIEGHPRADHGTVDAPIAKFSLNRPLRHLDPDGRQAITHWQIIERARTYSRVTLTPETGRSHQLRLHMASLGHAILGDVFYGDKNTHSRLCLHARALAFSHPHTCVHVSFEAPTPF